MSKNAKNNLEQQNIHDNKLSVTLIPFNFRKSPLLSISFLSLDLEMNKYKIKIESDGDINLKTPIISKLCDATIVSIKINFII